MDPRKTKAIVFHKQEGCQSVNCHCRHRSLTVRCRLGCQPGELLTRSRLTSPYASALSQLAGSIPGGSISKNRHSTRQEVVAGRPDSGLYWKRHSAKYSHLLSPTVMRPIKDKRTPSSVPTPSFLPSLLPFFLLRRVSLASN